ncbi:MAG: ABC transporter substrate-binding protein [Alphaproteobacteria bacterium]|nr:ABC transporter substrate-binding protein [Alphaproteobacteria bacterium]
MVYFFYRLLFVIALTSTVSFAGGKISKHELPSPQESIVFIKGLIDKGTVAVNKENATQDALGSILKENFDVNEIARFALGIHVRKFSPDQFARFKDVFEKRLVQVYSTKDKIAAFKDSIPTVLESYVKQADGTLMVKSTFRKKEGGGEPAKVDWNVIKIIEGTGSRLAVTDVLFENLSQRIAFRSEYGSLFTGEGKGDPERFIKFLAGQVG